MVDFYLYILGVFILIAFYLDVRYYKLPNWLTMSGILIGFTYHIIHDGFSGMFYSTFGLLVGGGSLLLFYIFKGVAAGDVKLFAAIGAITGVRFTLYGILYSVIFAGIIGVFILLFRIDLIKQAYYKVIRIIRSIFRLDTKDLEEFKKTEAVRFPFMYAVLPGMIMTVYYFL